MSLPKLVSEVVELCRQKCALQGVDLKRLKIPAGKWSPAATDYFKKCVPAKIVDRPFYILLTARELLTQNREFLPSYRTAPLGFITFANVPNGDAVAVDVKTGRVYILSHEVSSDFDDEEDGLTRKAVIENASGDFASLHAFFLKWREELLEAHRKEKEFLDKAAKDPNATDEFGYTILTSAIEAGDLKLVMAEVKRGASLEIFNSEGRSALGEAVTYGQAEIVKYLINQGANVNIRNEEGETPLMIAACYSQLECMKILLKAGADKRARAANRRNALGHLNVNHGTPAMKKLLKP